MPASKKHFCVRNALDLRCGMTREMTSGEEKLPALSAPEKIDIQNRGEAYCRSENAFTLSESPESFEAAREAVDVLRFRCRDDSQETFEGCHSS